MNEILDKRANRLSVKSDYVFKRLFTKKGNEEFLKEFLSNLLKMNITEIEIEHDKILDKNLKNDKYGILDVKARTNEGIEVNIEIQLNNENNIIEKSEFYASKMVALQLEQNGYDKKINPVIVVTILDFEYFKFEEYITKGVMVLDTHREKVINTVKTFYYIELPKFRKSKIDTEDKVSQWLAFIDGEDEGKIEEIISKNDNIKRADEELEYLSKDEATRKIAQLRESDLKEIASARNNGYIAGVEEGRIEIVKAMLKENASIDFISKVTGLTKEEIEKIL